MAILMKSLNPVSFASNCWLGAYPKGCRGDDCTRGKTWGFILDQVSHASLYLVVAILAFCNLAIYCEVRRTLGRNQRYTVGQGLHNDSTRPRRKRFSLELTTDRSTDSSFADEVTNNRSKPRRRASLESYYPRNSVSYLNLNSSKNKNNAANKRRQVAVRSFLFCGGFVLTYLFGTIVSETERWVETSYGTWWFYTFLVLDGLLWPLQGFWDSVIYFRPRYVQWRSAARPLNSRWFALYNTIFTIDKPVKSSASSRYIGEEKQSRRRTKDSDEYAADNNEQLSFLAEMRRNATLSGKEIAATTSSDGLVA